MRPWQLRQAIRYLRNGGIIAYPTEAVYGLGCDPLNVVAVNRLLALKKRPATKGLILIAANFEQLEPFIEILPQSRMKVIRATWPGPVTWLLPAASSTPRWLRGEHPSIAVRITAHPLAKALCQAFQGALVSTSANLAGRPPARNDFQVRRYFNEVVHYIVPGKLGLGTKPTEIREGRTGKVIRAA